MSSDTAKLWQGRSSGSVSEVTDALNRSIGFDCRLIEYDIAGSIAHVNMLWRQGIIPEAEAHSIVETLKAILADYQSGAFVLDLSLEDIHSAIELELTRRLGGVGKKLHTGRSRNDQVALDLRLFSREALTRIKTLLQALQHILLEKADKHQKSIMPGYTHLQRAQPVTFGYHLKAYHAMFSRDVSRLSDCIARLNFSPLGAGALAGSTFKLDRAMVAEALEFSGVMENTLDAVSSRDFVLEALSVLSILMTHLSRLAEELVLWSSQEFSFIRLDEAYTTGSSMMPQKKNPDLAELIRGKTGRVYGDLIALLSVMKALPLAYNKDMQEDKEPLFDAVDTVTLCLQAMSGMIETMAVNEASMRRACEAGFLNATDLADYLVRQGLPFREAYRLVGEAVACALELGQPLENIPLQTYQKISPYFEESLYDAIRLDACLKARGI
ncbi:MAG: argininosuccinate lyase [Vampirovibrionales bacterium]|nr:argininosuccinate lyase [Vampirovibrionales bacterium]